MRELGWVELPERTPHPKSPLVVLIPKVAVILTPCHAAPHLYPQRQAVAGAWLSAVCDDCGAHLTIQLQADPTAEFGLRAHWPDTSQEQAQ